MAIRSSFTVLLEDPFWIGLYERVEGDMLEVCKITFGAEPKDYEVYDFLLRNWHNLKLSPPIKVDGTEKPKISPKRMQREINRQLENRGIGTKAQQALKLQYEQSKMERKKKSREQKEAGTQVYPPPGKEESKAQGTLMCRNNAIFSAHDVNVPCLDGKV